MMAVPQGPQESSVRSRSVAVPRRPVAVGGHVCGLGDPPPSLEGTHIGRRELEPFTLRPTVSKATVPVPLHAVRIIRADLVDECLLGRQCQADLTGAPQNVGRATDLVPLVHADQIDKSQGSGIT